MEFQGMTKRDYGLLILIHTFLLIGLPLLCFSQSLQSIRYSEDNGLTNTLVKSVTTDNNGLIWVATDGGLFLFDGTEFSPWPGEVPSHYIKHVFTRESGDVVISTDMGVIVACSREKEIVAKQLCPGSIQPVDSMMWFPKCSFEDSKGRLWVSDNRRVHCVTGEKIKSYFIDEKAVTNSYHRSFSIAEDAHGQLFAFSETGYIYSYDSNADRFTEVPLLRPLSNINAALTVDSQNILVATRSGLVIFRPGRDGKNHEIIPLQSTPEISCLFNYAEGKFYAGTWSSGLYEIAFDGRNFSVHRLSGIREKNINSIVEGSNGNIWMASDNGLLLLQQHLFTAPFEEATTGYIQSISCDDREAAIFCDGEKVFSAPVNDHDYPSGHFTVVKKSTATTLQALPFEGGMWFSDVEGRIWYERPVGKVVRTFDFSGQGRAVFYLKTDHSGNLWACQDQNPSLICISPDFKSKTYGTGQGLSSRPLVVMVDSSGTLYCGGMEDSSYLFRYDPSADRFVNLSVKVDFEHNIAININDMAIGKDGVLWLGSSFGLLKYFNDKVSRIELGQMSELSVKAVAVDQNGSLWFGNSLGLHLLCKNEILYFDDRSGMSSKIINYRCLTIDSDNRIWVGTVEGVFVSSPLKIPRLTTKPMIFKILLNNRKEVLFQPEGISFNDRSFVTLKVGVLDYPSVDFRLEMMLKGRDTAWQPVPRSGILILANLPSGEHTLLLRAKRSGNYLTSEVLEWKFSVYRIWYTRIWVILLMAALLVFILWSGVHLYTQNLKKNNEKLENAVRERTRETLEQKERIEAQNLSIIQKNDELLKANTGLEKARAIAEEASETQKKFLAVMTHELRTPLHAVIGAAHLLIRNNPREDQQENLQILRFSAENLLSLINNILDFQKIESGKVSLETIPFNLKNLVDEIIAALNIRAREKGIDLRCHLDERLPDHLLGDPLRLSQIINNLTGNAMKFTDKGSVEVEVLMKERVGEDIFAEFLIRDTGIGMSRETIDSVFEIFVQGSSETTRKYGGTGLGLVITKKLLELYGSEIRVESEPGKGSSFCFMIRFREAVGEEHKLPVSHNAYEFSRFKGQRILLVEDNLVNKVIAGKFLKEWDLSFDHAINGLVALDMVREHYYDLILMDIQMPEMDGYQASAAIRALGSSYHSGVPIIALTAAIRSDVSAMIFRSGMNDYISKPFNPIDLHQKISKYLSASHSKQI